MSEYKFTDKEFWIERIKKYNGNLYDAVQVGGVQWDVIEAYHKSVFKEHLKGRVLDVGCGWGRASKLMPQTVTEYIGIDISPEFIKEAEKKFPGLMFLVGDARKLPFKDKEFDWTVAIGMGGHEESGISDFFKQIKSEMERVSKKTMVMWLSKIGQYDIHNNNTYLSS